MPVKVDGIDTDLQMGSADPLIKYLLYERDDPDYLVPYRVMAGLEYFIIHTENLAQIRVGNHPMKGWFLLIWTQDVFEQMSDSGSLASFWFDKEKALLDD